LFIFEDNENKGFKFNYKTNGFRYTRSLKVKIELPFPCFYSELLEIDHNIISLVYLRNVNDEYSRNKIYFKTFNIDTKEKKILEKSLSLTHKRRSFDFINPKVFLNVYKKNIMVLFVTNPLTYDFNNNHNDVNYYVESFKLLDFQ
jgi:hypothetical protein